MDGPKDSETEAEVAERQITKEVLEIAIYPPLGKVQKEEQSIGEQAAQSQDTSQGAIDGAVVSALDSAELDRVEVAAVERKVHT